MSSHSPKPSLLIAFGGNALNVPGNAPAHQKEEFHQARRSMEQLVPLLERGYEKIILTHPHGAASFAVSHDRKLPSRLDRVHR